MSAATSISDARQAGKVLLRLMCVVSLWHAPIPWIHVHSARGVELAHHLEHFHPDLAGHHAEESVGWHWHAVLPPWGRAPSSCPGDDEPSPLTAIGFEPVVAGAVVAWHVDIGHAVWNAVPQPLVSTPHGHRGGPRTSFWEPIFKVAVRSKFSASVCAERSGRAIDCGCLLFVLSMR